MLIIAMPKSASTSLMYTLANLHGLECKQVLNNKELLISDDYKELSINHSDAREYDNFDWMEKDIVYKQHIPPTENNISKLTPVKKVILLRNVDDIIEGYLRGGAKRVKDKELAEQLKKELEAFECGWANEWASTENVFICNFKILINYPTIALNSIEDFFNLPLSKNVVLEKHRYTRG